MNVKSVFGVQTTPTLLVATDFSALAYSEDAQAVVSALFDTVNEVLTSVPQVTPSFPEETVKPETLFPVEQLFIVSSWSGGRVRVKTPPPKASEGELLPVV